MKITHFLLLAAAFTIGHNALAADSKSNRADSTFRVVISPYGFAKEIHDPVPVTLGYYLNESFSLGVQIGSVNRDYQPGESDEEVAYTNIGIIARFFSDGSLNFIAAAHQKVWEGTLKISAQSGAYAEADLNATSTVVTVGIGNEWVSDFGFTWGFDWIVSSTALSSSYSISNINNQGLTSSQLQILTDRAKETADTVNEVSLTPAVFVLNIGWSF